jgi:hypothetical protein
MNFLTTEISPQNCQSGIAESDTFPASQIRNQEEKSLKQWTKVAVLSIGMIVAYRNSRQKCQCPGDKVEKLIISLKIENILNNFKFILF